MFTSGVLSARMNQLLETYPFVYNEIIGTSRLGKPLYALCIGYGPVVLGYNAAHHANEWITSALLMKFVEEYCEYNEKNPQAGYLERFTLCAVVMVNPDGVDWVINGLKPGDWKSNACGVDLNANYPASWERVRDRQFALGFTEPGSRGFVGKSPLCEPESCALAAYTVLRDFALTVSLHTQGEEIYWSYAGFDPPNAREIAGLMEKAGGYLCVDVPEESSHGGYRDWFIQHFNRPGFTIECGLGENPLPFCDFDGIYERVSKILWIPLLHHI
jgi:g-D-glutamyl-meso-diaminopimelate peptidase